MRAIDVVRRLAPRAKANYVQAFEQGDKVLSDYGVTTPLRLAHFLAQVMHETNGLTILRESGAYSASRMMEIFGVGKHSAAITWAEAKKLAYDGPAIFERAYGLGNPKMAHDLGNTQPGDGWRYRGNGIMQTTGRGNHRRMGEKVGLSDLFERDPEKVTAAEYALLPALAEWKESGCNALADKNDIASITKRINGGYNGFADRKAWFAKIYPLVSNGVAWTDAEPDPDIKEVQESLNALGYGLTVDGRKGPATEKAVRDFQAKNGLKVDGIAGQLTREKLKAAIAAPKANTDPGLKPMPDGKASKSGTIQAAATAAGTAATGMAIEAAKHVSADDVANAVQAGKEVAGAVKDNQDQLSAGTWIGFVLFGLGLAFALFLIWKRYRDAGMLPKWLPSWLGGAA